MKLLKIVTARVFSYRKRFPLDSESKQERELFPNFPLNGCMTKHTVILSSMSTRPSDPCLRYKYLLLTWAQLSEM